MKQSVQQNCCFCQAAPYLPCPRNRQLVILPRMAALTECELGREHRSPCTVREAMWGLHALLLKTVHALATGTEVLGKTNCPVLPGVMIACTLQMQ